MPYKTREEWLTQGIILLTNEVFRPATFKVPKNIQVSCGLPSIGAFGKKRQRIGECWYAVGKDGVHQLFISPINDNPVTVLDVLTHEIVHTISGAKAGHRGQFKKVAWGVGLEGPMRATHAGPDLKKLLDQFSHALGKYPHKKITKIVTGRKPQKCRQIKVACECGYTCRLAMSWIEDVGAPICPACNVPMELA